MPGSAEFRRPMYCRAYSRYRQMEIGRDDYDKLVALPVRRCLEKQGLVESVLYLVTTLEVPLKIAGTMELNGNAASVDSELALLYADIKQNKPHRIDGVIANPFFGKKDARFVHPDFPMYLVTTAALWRSAGASGTSIGQIL